MSEERNSDDGIENFFFEYSLFLLTAARGTVDEPKIYGALRLVDAIGRLTEVYSRSDAFGKDEFLLSVKSEIEANIDTALTSEADFVRFMDRLIVKFTDEMKKRYARA
jgi:hypothetical protein